MAPTILDKLDIFQVVDSVPPRSTDSPKNCCFESLSNEILDFYAKNVVSRKKLETVTNFLNVLQLKLHFNEHFGPKTKIETFGSMSNGMATEASDLDLAITVGDENEYEKEYKVFLLENMLVSLQSVGCYDIEAILTANVPIIKCKWVDNQTKIELEIDISIFNPLAVRNTALLRQYCSWDKRLPQLVFYLKKFAKEEGISGANKHFLSSYALVIMLIHYLQQVNVLPVIQEDFRTELDFAVMAEGFDSYFDEKVIPNWSTNKSNVAKLFYGFLEFYSDFNYDYVIKIDQRRKCLQHRKFWTSPLGVQDPFMYTRNVAGMVSRYNRQIIVNVFRDKVQSLLNECHTSVIQAVSVLPRTVNRKRRAQSPLEILLERVAPVPNI